jgi:hypothetical protein
MGPLGYLICKQKSNPYILGTNKGFIDSVQIYFVHFRLGPKMGPLDYLIYKQDSISYIFGGKKMFHGFGANVFCTLGDKAQKWAL